MTSSGDWWFAWIIIRGFLTGFLVASGELVAVGQQRSNIAHWVYSSINCVASKLLHRLFVSSTTCLKAVLNTSSGEVCFLGLRTLLSGLSLSSLKCAICFDMLSGRLVFANWLTLNFCIFKGRWDVGGVSSGRFWPLVLLLTSIGHSQGGFSLCKRSHLPYMVSNGNELVWFPDSICAQVWESGNDDEDLASFQAFYHLTRCLHTFWHHPYIFLHFLFLV